MKLFTTLTGYLQKSIISNPLISLVVGVIIFLNLLHRLITREPGYIWKKRNIGKRANHKVIAHRGSKDDGLPENTIAAFKDGIKAGAHMVELDVWLSKDGRVVVFHDPDFSRMTSKKDYRMIRETKYDDFPTIDPPDEQDSRADEYPKKECLRIPLFQEVLQIVPDNIGVIIELKMDSDELIDKVWEIVQSFGTQRVENVFWFSLSEPINAKLRSRRVIPTITSIPAMLKVLFLFYLGVLPYVDIKDDVFGVTVSEITIDTVRHEKAVEHFPEFVKVLLAWLLSGKPPSLMVAPLLFRHLRKRGIPVWFLGVNELGDVVIASESGVTGVLTDKVSLVNAVFKSLNCPLSDVEQ